MGRLLIGLCRVGSWGCFDEFNRLEERMLSAISQQIQAIQLGLRESSPERAQEISLLGRNLLLKSDTGMYADY